MAVVEFVNRPNKTYAGMRKVINYVLNPNKTNKNLVTGIGLMNPDDAFNEMVGLKKFMGKTDRRLWYHFIQSFPPYDNITPELALRVANETAEYFREQYQILVSVHTDKNHIHAHFVLNTVNIETGRKYTQNNAQRIEIQAFSDRICEKYNLHVLTEEQKNTGKYRKSGEYRAEQAGLSWKEQLKSAVDDVLSTAVSRDDFIRKMEKINYQVKWSDTRENITFTTPTGMRCRDRRLGEPEYYNKHNFEIIFEQNAKYADNIESGFDMPIKPIMQGISNIARLFDGDDNLQVVSDGFMLQDIDFESKSQKEIEDTIARLRHEAEIRKSRAMANQAEIERKAAQQAFNQAIAILEELEKWLLERKLKENEVSYIDDENTLEL